MYAMRGLAAAAVFAMAVYAGTMASSSGSDTAAPMPLSTVRRERCVLVRNMSSPTFFFDSPCVCAGTFSIWKAFERTMPSTIDEKR